MPENEFKIIREIEPGKHYTAVESSECGVAMEKRDDFPLLVISAVDVNGGGPCAGLTVEAIDLLITALQEMRGLME